MSERLPNDHALSLSVADPSLVVSTADGRVIPSAEYYDQSLAGWASNDPYAELSSLEDAMASRGYNGHKRRPDLSVPVRETDLFIRRPVVPAVELVGVLEAVAPFHNPNRGTRCHKPGLDRDNGLHTTLLNTRGITGIYLPDEELFEPALRVPSLAEGLGKLMLGGATIFEGGSNFYVVLEFAQKAKDKLREERSSLESAHFPSLSLRQQEGRVFRPHVTVVSTNDSAIAEQALDAIQNRADVPKKLDLAPARHTFYKTKYADAIV